MAFAISFGLPSLFNLTRSTKMSISSFGWIATIGVSIAAEQIVQLPDKHARSLMLTTRTDSVHPDTALAKLGGSACCQASQSEF